MRNTMRQPLVKIFHNNLLFTTMWIGLVGCATAPAEYRRTVSGVKELKFASTSCNDIGAFDGGEKGMSLSQAKDALLFKVGKAGGNAVVIDHGSATTYGTGTNTTVSGIGYKCAE